MARSTVALRSTVTQETSRCGHRLRRIVEHSRAGRPCRNVLVILQMCPLIRFFYSYLNKKPYDDYTFESTTVESEKEAKKNMMIHKSTFAIHYINSHIHYPQSSTRKFRVYRVLLFSFLSSEKSQNCDFIIYPCRWIKKQRTSFMQQIKTC